MGQRNRVLDGRAHWRHLENTVERLPAAAGKICHHAWRRGHAACFQITSGNLAKFLKYFLSYVCTGQTV